jgi:hypothetical protein
VALIGILAFLTLGMWMKTAQGSGAGEKECQKGPPQNGEVGGARNQG